MALYKDIRSKIIRQELDLVMAGPHFGLYSAKVKYLPENIEKPDFFSLCCGVLKKGDEIALYTNKRGVYEIYYKYLVIGVDVEAKTVDVLLLKKVDLLNPVENVEVEGVDTEVLNAAIIKIVDSKVKHLVEEVNTLKTNFEQYTTDTDDQLEEIETILGSLNQPVEEAAKEEEAVQAAKSANAPATPSAQSGVPTGTKPAETK